MRRRIVEIFIRSIDKETLAKFIQTKKDLMRDYALNPSGDVDAAAERYRKELNKNRNMVRQALS